MSLNELVRSFKKMVLKNIEYCWAKMNPIIFVHSSDLMLPGDTGLTGMQLLVISRLIDIENRDSEGERYYWHTRLGELYYKHDYTTEEKEKLNEKFERFLHAVNTRGFNPDLSHISVAHLPIMGQSDGTHRMGYLLSQQPNVFVPTQILSPITWTGKPIDGISWLSQIGASSEEIEQLLERYRLLYNKMRRQIIAVVDKNVFDQKRAALMSEIESIGKCIGVKYAHKRSDNSKKMEVPKQYKRFFKKKTEIIILEIEIERQVLYYKNRKLKSKLADNLIDRWHKTGETGGYVAGTITESIALETYLEENYSIGGNNLCTTI